MGDVVSLIMFDRILMQNKKIKEQKTEVVLRAFLSPSKCSVQLSLMIGVFLVVTHEVA